MDSRSSFLHRVVERPGGRERAGQPSHWTWRVPSRSGSGAKTPAYTVRGRPRASYGSTRVIVCPSRPEKPRRYEATRPYRKPTQVGKEKSPQANG